VRTIYTKTTYVVEADGREYDFAEGHLALAVELAALFTATGLSVTVQRVTTRTESETVNWLAEPMSTLVSMGGSV
jgi:hypothetical protein